MTKSYTLLFFLRRQLCSCTANELISPPSLLWLLDIFIGGGGGGGGAAPAGGPAGPGGGGGAGGALVVLWWPGPWTKQPLKNSQLTWLIPGVPVAAGAARRAWGRPWPSARAWRAEQARCFGASSARFAGATWSSPISVALGSLPRPRVSSSCKMLWFTVFAMWSFLWRVHWL